VRREASGPNRCSAPVVITASPDGVVIDVRVIPRASKPGVAGVRDNALLVRLTAPPVEGAANAELIDVMARAAGVPRRAVSIVSGDRNRMKRVAISGISVVEAARAFPDAAQALPGAARPFTGRGTT
jgi:uncharacterized protein